MELPDRWFTVGEMGEEVELGNGVRFPAWVNVAMTWRTRSTQPLLNMRLEVDEGKPVLTFVSLRRAETGPPITPTLLRSLPLGEITEQAIQWVVTEAWARREQAAGRLRFPPQDPEDFDRLLVAWDRLEPNRHQASQVRRMRTVDDELLREVADVYSKDNTGKPTVAVAEQLYTSHRNATRWVALARRQGFLPPYGKEGK